MKKLIAIGILALTIGGVLSGCSSSNGGDGTLVPSTDGDNVVITELTEEQTDKVIENLSTTFQEFSPTLDGDTITFITSGSSDCKQTPIAAKADTEATKVAFKVYDQETKCNSDFGTYGWTIKFEDNPPFDGVPYLRCEGDTCYNDTDGTTQDW